MLSGGPTPLWAQLRTFKHIKISQALHCPDYCLNIICFYILSLPLWLIFPLKLYPSVMIFFYRGFRVERVSVSVLSHKDIELPLTLSHTFCMFFTVSDLLQRTQIHPYTWRSLSCPTSASQTFILTLYQPLWGDIVCLEMCMDDYWCVYTFLMERLHHCCSVTSITTNPLCSSSSDGNGDCKVLLSADTNAR